MPSTWRIRVDRTVDVKQKCTGLTIPQFHLNARTLICVLLFYRAQTAQNSPLGKMFASLQNHGTAAGYQRLCRTSADLYSRPLSVQYPTLRSVTTMSRWWPFGSWQRKRTPAQQSAATLQNGHAAEKQGADDSRQDSANNTGDLAFNAEKAAARIGARTASASSLRTSVSAKTRRTSAGAYARQTSVGQGDRSARRVVATAAAHARPSAKQATPVQGSEAPASVRPSPRRRSGQSTRSGSGPAESSSGSTIRARSSSQQSSNSKTKTVVPVNALDPPLPYRLPRRARSHVWALGKNSIYEAQQSTIVHLIERARSGDPYLPSESVLREAHDRISREGAEDVRRCRAFCDEQWAQIEGNMLPQLEVIRENLVKRMSCGGLGPRFRRLASGLETQLKQVTDGAALIKADLNWPVTPRYILLALPMRFTALWDAYDDVVGLEQVLARVKEVE